MTKALRQLIEAAETWRLEDQLELAAFAREIEARRSGVYVMDDDERAAVAEGLAQAARGEFASEAEMEQIWSRLRFGRSAAAL